MQARFWNFNKRVNSTKQPTDEGQLVTFTYKDASDLHNPILMLNGWVNNWNYAKVGDIYFFVNRCEAIANNLFHVYLNIDVLATYKANILATKAHVLYSSNNWNKHLLDNRVVASADYTLDQITGHKDITNSVGTYMVTCIADIGLSGFKPTDGLTITYFLTPTQMKDLANVINNSEGWDAIKLWWENPLECIIECAWLPLDINEYFTTEDAEVVIGKLKTGVTAKTRLSGTTTSYMVNSKELNFPLIWAHDDFRRLEPYTILDLYFPICGLIHLSSSDFYNDIEIKTSYTIDILNGIMELRIYNSSNLVTTASGNMKVILPIGHVQTRTSSIVNFGAGAVATGALAVSGHPAAAVTSGAYAVSNLLTPRQAITNGALQGSFINGNSINKPMLYITRKNTSDLPNNILNVVGGACSKVLELSTCTGFTKTDDASVSANAYLSELNQINSMLNGGVYIE